VGCGTEWPREEGEADDGNEPREDGGAAPANRSSTKRRKRVKCELVEEANHSAGLLTAAVPRRARTLRRANNPIER
jgi:non-structural maintenance of chromosomes element 1